MQRRAALAVLCVFAVALSASLFPAGGFGSAPTGVGTGGPDAPAGSSAAGPPGDAADRSPDGDDPAGTTGDRSATTADPPDGSDGSDESNRTTTTATTTETETPAEGSDDGGSDALAALWGVLTLFGGLLVVGLWTGVLGFTARTAGPLPVTMTVGGTPVGELVGAIPARTMSLVVGLSASVPRLLDDAAGLARAVGGTLSSVAAGVARGTGDALRIAVGGLGATLAAIPTAFAGLGAGAGLLSSLGDVSLPSLGRRSRDRSRNSPGNDRDAADDPEETGPQTVEEAWQAMTDRVRVRNPDARTPGEFAREAVDRGYPDDAVGRLTDAFREVRYGGLPRSDRTDAARAAFEKLRDHWGDRK